MSWTYWQGEWAADEKVCFSGDLRIIYVNPAVTELDIRVDVYSAWVRWNARDSNSKYWNAVRYTGLDPIPGGQTGDTYFLYNGWKLYIDLTSVKVSGVLYSDDFATAYFDAATGKPVFPATVAAIVNTVATGGGGGATAAAVRVEMDANSTKLSALTAKLDTVLTYVDELEARLSQARAAKLDRLDRPVSEVAPAVWSSRLDDHVQPQSFGAFIQKLLTVAKFLGLK